MSFNWSGTTRFIVILDGNGKERVHREVVDDGSSPTLKPGDLDGDGRDELLVSYGGLVHVWDRNMKELWFWPSRSSAIDQIVPASAGRPREVILAPGLSLDAVTGQARWTGQAPLVESPAQFLPKLLDPGDAKRLPLLLRHGLGATVCRVAMPTAGDGSIAPVRGAAWVPVSVPRDPRWARPLPWSTRFRGVMGPWGFLVAGALALVNVVFPLWCLRLVAGRRRFFNMRALMALPLAAAVPLMTYVTFARWLPTGSGRLRASEGRVFLTATVAGLPIAYYLLWAGASVVRKRWKRASRSSGGRRWRRSRWRADGSGPT